VRPVTWRWLLVSVWAALIFALSAQPSLPGPTYPGLDKLVHVVEFLALAVFLAAALRATGAAPGRSAVFAVIFAVLYGATDEFHQRYVPGRETDLYDLAADFLGASTGAAAWYARVMRTARRTNQ
jgi:VanZ family protein